MPYGMVKDVADMLYTYHATNLGFKLLLYSLGRKLIVCASLQPQWVGTRYVLLACNIQQKPWTGPG